MCVSVCPSQVNEAADLIYDMVHEDCQLIFGAVVDPSLQDTVTITLIATGCNSTPAPSPSRPQMAVPKPLAQPAAAVAVAAPAPKPAAAPAAPVVQDMGGMDGIGGIEIPAFLRRRRLQGK